MTRLMCSLMCVLLAWVGFVRPARAEEFLKEVDLDAIEIMTVQDNATLKTMDTLARQRLTLITGKSSLNGIRALPAVLDIMLRPEMYREKNIIKVKNVPLRKDFEDFAGIDAAEKKRILEEGTVSLMFLMRQDVQAFLEQVSSQATFKSNAVQDLMNAGGAMVNLNAPGGFLPLAIVPPVVEGDIDWKQSASLLWNSPRHSEVLRSGTASGMAMSAKPLPGYETRGAAIQRTLDAQESLRDAWRAQSVAGVNAAIKTLTSSVIDINPAVYPKEIKRKTEVIYNRAAKLTIPGAFGYFGAFTVFLLAVYSGVPALRKWGMVLFVLAFAIHTVAIGVRWWLVSKSVGNWFESIPIKNQFESVLFSSWFGGLVGLVLELWKGKEKWGGIWGAASSFVGWLSLVAIFSAPFVAGRDIGGEIGMAAGVLMSYWLYIHVTMVVAAYALIGMSFMLGLWWLIKSMTQSGRGPSLDTLDACNMVILQLAFWVLGVGIILGAIWADQSWGRPWGWDPKETFALVTWIVYLAVVHIRLATTKKAMWTSVLSIVGFAIMLFNWIGVNFFLVGLHSYA